MYSHSMGTGYKEIHSFCVSITIMPLKHFLDHLTAHGH